MADNIVLVGMLAGVAFVGLNIIGGRTNRSFANAIGIGAVAMMLLSMSGFISISDILPIFKMDETTSSTSQTIDLTKPVKTEPPQNKIKHSEYEGNPDSSIGQLMFAMFAVILLIGGIVGYLAYRHLIKNREERQYEKTKRKPKRTV